jgi:hypothetical protein
MARKNIERHQIVLELLSENRYLLGDLQKAANIKHAKQLLRILHEYEEKGLVQQTKKRGKWSLTDKEYEDRHLKHSRDLLPVLQFLRTAPLEKIARQEILLNDKIKDNKYVEKDMIDFGQDKAEQGEILLAEIAPFMLANQAVSDLPRDTREEKATEFPSNFSIEQHYVVNERLKSGKYHYITNPFIPIYHLNFSIERYCAVREHLQHGKYHYITEPFDQIMLAYSEMDDFRRERVAIINSEEYKEVETSIYELKKYLLTKYWVHYEKDQQKKDELWKKIVEEETEKGRNYADYCKQRSEDYVKLKKLEMELGRLNGLCKSLLEKSFKYKIKHGKLKRQILDRFDGDIKRLIYSINNGVALYGECHICKEFNKEEDTPPLSTGHYFIH